MRRVFLKQAPAARPFVSRLPPAQLASYPLSHPRGIVQYMCFVLGTCAVCTLAWTVFVAVIIAL